MIGILDYGMANLRSVNNAFAHAGHPAQIIKNADEVKKCDRLVLPGVGAFRDAMVALRSEGVDGAIRDHIKAGKPFLGICLGLQMLFDIGYEDGEHEGLGIFRGDCVRFDVDHTLGLKVPHMGWNQLDIQQKTPLFDGVPDHSNVYFVHAYHVQPQDPAIIAATTDYGRPFVSVIAKDNVVACQFHPEKSQAIGQNILQNFGKM